MWRRLSPQAWVFQAPNDDAIPRELRIPGFVLVLGLRTTSKTALGDLLSILDVCHQRQGAFTLASGGLYCAEDDLSGGGAQGASSIDFSLPKGFHTEWHHLLANRPLLLRDAQNTLLYTQWLIGALCVRLGEWPGNGVGDATLLPTATFLEKVPPLFHCMWNTTVTLACMTPKQQRALRRTLRKASAEDAFDPQFIRHLLQTCDTTQP